MSLDRTRGRHVSHWEVWQVPHRVLTAILAVEGLAVGLVAGELVVARPHWPEVGTAGLLAGLGILHTEVAGKVEQMRRRVSGASYYDLSSVWTFAAALLLPPPLTAAVVVAVYLHLWVRVWRPAKTMLYRNLYTTAVVVLAAQAARAVVCLAGGPAGWTAGPVGLVVLTVAVVAYTLVNNLLVAVAIALQAGTRPTRRQLLGEPGDLVLELSTLSLGAITAVALTINPWLVLLVLLPLLVLHRADMVRQLEERAATDGKTGLLNAAAWQKQAERALHRAQRQNGAAGVLILDLDHFKAVNDTHGHLAGDEVLVAVAKALEAEVREGDVVGRFGGEEFVVLVRDLELSGSGRRQLEAVAERIRARIAALSVSVQTPDGPLSISGLSTSVGGVFHLGRTSTLEQVLGAADVALYAAKRDGRNLVRFGSPVGITAPARPGPAPG